MSKSQGKYWYFLGFLGRQRHIPSWSMGWVKLTKTNSYIVYSVSSTRSMDTFSLPGWHLWVESRCVAQETFRIPRQDGFNKCWQWEEIKIVQEALMEISTEVTLELWKRICRISKIEHLWQKAEARWGGKMIEIICLIGALVAVLLLARWKCRGLQKRLS